MITIDKIEKMEETLDLTERAKKHFGTTKNPHEAGYITHDGHMLDFSGRHWNPDDKSLKGHRYVDHRDVGEVDESLGNGDEHPIDEFQRKTNAIRVHSSRDNHSLNLSFHHNAKPTAHQWNAIKAAHNTMGNPAIYFDHAGKDNGIVDNVDQLRRRFI